MLMKKSMQGTFTRQSTNTQVLLNFDFDDLVEDEDVHRFFSKEIPRLYPDVRSIEINTIKVHVSTTRAGKNR